MTALTVGTAVLGFKDEDEVDGQPIGPVFDAVINVDGHPVALARLFDPNRAPDPWVTLAQAQAMATERGLPLIEV